MRLAHQKDKTVSLFDPQAVPTAGSYLWNAHTLLQVNCQGYANAQFLQPEPAKYASGPSLEATTFMQPEQPIFEHSPGRFVYVKDARDGGLFSLPFAPSKQTFEHFEFQCANDAIYWHITHRGLRLSWQVSLHAELAVEVWTLTISALDTAKQIDIYPYFPFGYRSWMNQSADFDSDLNGIICRSVTPYQKTADYFKQKEFKDLSFLLADQPPISWDARQQAFEGNGGLRAPQGVMQPQLSQSSAHYELPTAALHYQLSLTPGGEKTFRFAFGPANNRAEIEAIRATVFRQTPKLAKPNWYADQTLQMQSNDPQLDAFVNFWLPRQIAYHGDLNRLTTDPQTRNYLQDAMGLCYLAPAKARQMLLTTLGQQYADGALPDGVLLHANASLKYINQVPHTDHAVWLPIALQAYLQCSNDTDVFDLNLPFADSSETASVFTHCERALSHLLAARDHRQLSLIGQGDWCDPMNMVGYQGKGVSAWLTFATIYALQTWLQICARLGRTNQRAFWQQAIDDMTTAANTHFWHGDWFGRGITDAGRLFGIDGDEEGAIFLNPQTWALLSQCVNEEQQTSMLAAVTHHLETPYGVELVTPAFTQMHEDIGRVTQKFPGTAENGSVYNHAAAFYIYALYTIGEADHAYRLIRKMIPSLDEPDLTQRGQLPNFIPNYYRGASRQFPRTAGRSSLLFNTGTVHWLYRSLVEGLLGILVTANGVRFAPQPPSTLRHMQACKHIAGVQLDITIERTSSATCQQTYVDGVRLPQNELSQLTVGKQYSVQIQLPATTQP
ncbi:cellobionic acid phosphorylase [Arenicella chitinivorans]|uniref:Cellobionic acid phosphorylase n=1 Tax=Arenicella chitinivorans TaxID=1329800 RepID=A0A918VFX5_9GAMM|nr:NdvB protein [Arenicella chitinivorans]GGZ97950.1 cellobionic acid phosphorylase [Arenicella chitinivorans]